MAFFCPQKFSSPIPPDQPEQPEQPVFKRPLPLLPPDVSVTLQQAPAGFRPPFLPSTRDRQFVRDGIRYNCFICTRHHEHSKPCPSKPPRHPSLLYKACDICNGHHPPNCCYFETIKKFLYTPTPCSNCKGLVHAYYCEGTLTCKKCNTRHNGVNNCPRRELFDISNNLCPNCKTYHVFHCPKNLKEINITNVLWCNLCKLHHAFMKCTAFCTKCLRHHIESSVCPSPSDFCHKCMISHFGSFCPFNLATLPLTYPQELGIPVQHSNPTYIDTTPEKLARRSGKRKSPAILSPVPLPAQSPRAPSSCSSSEDIYICADDCTCKDCKPVRFLSEGRNPTPLPRFEYLI